MGGSTTTNNITNTDPWSGQQKYLKDIFAQSQQIYNSQKGTPQYTGNFVAAPRPEEMNAFQSALNFAGGQGQSAVNQTLNTGGAMANQGMAGVGAGMSGLFNAANRDSTGQNIAAAGQYANNPYLSGQIDSALRDAGRTFSEQVIPGIDRGAASTGNMNSSRAGIASGIAQRGYQDMAGDVASQMRGNAYQQGIQQASADNQQGLAASQALGALGSDMSKSGLYGLGQGMTMAKDNMGNAIMGSAGLQSLDQRVLDNALQRYNYTSTYPWQALNNYSNIAAGKSWGGTSTSNTTQSTDPGALGIIGGISGAIGNIFKCDIRTKQNIVRIGQMDNGVPLYVFSYRDDPTNTLKIGPMAQEVEAFMPEAVLEIDGVKHVDMALLAKGETN